MGVACTQPANTKSEETHTKLFGKRRKGFLTTGQPMSRTGGPAESTVAAKEGRCCTRKSWGETLWMYKILIGLMCVFVSLYDLLKPLIQQEKVTFELRGATINFFFLTFGFLLILGSTCYKGFVMKHFGFLETSIGMAASLLFAGFLLIKNMDIRVIDTYFGCYMLSGSVVYFLDIVVRGCCCRKKDRKEEGTGSESQSLLANESGAPIVEGQAPK